MARTQTPGITVDGDSRRIIDKEHRGRRIFVRLGRISEDDAKRRLTAELQRIDEESQLKQARPRFADGAARYLYESQDKRSVEAARWHVRLLTPYIGTLELKQIHDRTLEHSLPIASPKA
jgi:hypothetical protein